ncbi:DUF2335 domain-containing protein [Collinsella aerofaciens]
MHQRRNPERDKQYDSNVRDAAQRIIEQIEKDGTHRHHLALNRNQTL